jgi:hypothetical protein
MEGLDPKGGNLSESRFLYAGSGSAMKLMGPRTMRGTVLKRADLDMEGLDPKGGNLSESRSLYAGSGSAMKLMGPRTMRFTVLKRADLDIEGLHHKGGDLFESRSPFTGSGSTRILMGGTEHCTAPFSRELTWISKGSTPRAATFLNTYPYILDPDLK